jgi:antitoxin component of MazEF toxin-antitoxin module
MFNNITYQKKKKKSLTTLIDEMRTKTKELNKQHARKTYAKETKE